MTNPLHKIYSIFDSSQYFASATFIALTLDPLRKIKIAVLSICISGAALVLFIVYVLHAPFLVTAAVIVLFIFFVYISMVPTLSRVREALDLQKRFVSSVSHELRGPMSTMQIDSEIALHDTSDGPISVNKTRELIGAINSDLEGLHQMANIIRNLSLITAQGFGREQLELEKIDLQALLVKLCPSAGKQFADKKDIEIKVEGTAPVYVMGSESALEQIIMNLLKNAVRYSPKGTEVVASVIETENGETLSIRDHGYGISEQDLPYILDPFYKGVRSDENVNPEKSTGLGLAIVAALAKQQKAVVNITSALNKGTTVSLHFPLTSQSA